MLYIGCPAWGTKAWVGHFFPPRTPTSAFLRLYSQRLTTVEGNTTFYALPSAETIARWKQETPATFRFCPKVARSISHAPRLDETREDVSLFVERMSGLGERLGPMFLQLPPTFAPAQLPHLRAFLEFWPAHIHLAVEVRHPAFFDRANAARLNDLLSQYHVARVIMDSRPIRIGNPQEREILEARERKPNLPVEIARTADFVFLRYIGHPSPEVNEPFLARWAQLLGQWHQEGVTPYVFCHCPLDEHAPTICADLYQRVQAVTPLPPLPWQPVFRATQAKLFS